MYKTKTLALAALAILFGGVFLSAEAQKRSMSAVFIDPPPPVVETALSGNYNVSVNASELSVGEVEPVSGTTYGWTCYGTTEGDLSGFLFISMNYTSDYSFPAEVSPKSVNTVTGGSWSKLIFVNGVYAGSISGKIVGGEMAHDKVKGMTTINLELAAEKGTGDYVGSVGSGTFEGTLDQTSKGTPSVSGQLTFKF